MAGEAIPVTGQFTKEERGVWKDVHVTVTLFGAAQTEGGWTAKGEVDGVVLVGNGFDRLPVREEVVT